MAEGLNQYETVIIVSTKLGEDGNAALVQKFKDRIAKHGTVESVDDWGKRRLAYPINKETEGYYTLINFTSVPDFTAELDRRYQIADGILRSLIIKKDPKHVLADAKRKQKQAEQALKAAEEKVAEEPTVDVEAVAAEAIAAEVVDTQPAVEAVTETQPAAAETPAEESAE